MGNCWTVPRSKRYRRKWRTGGPNEDEKNVRVHIPSAETINKINELLPDASTWTRQFVDEAKRTARMMSDDIADADYIKDVYQRTNGLIGRIAERVPEYKWVIGNLDTPEFRTYYNEMHALLLECKQAYTTIWQRIVQLVRQQTGPHSINLQDLGVDIYWTVLHEYDQKPVSDRFISADVIVLLVPILYITDEYQADLMQIRAIATSLHIPMAEGKSGSNPLTVDVLSNETVRTLVETINLNYSRKRGYPPIQEAVIIDVFLLALSFDNGNEVRVMSDILDYLVDKMFRVRSQVDLYALIDEFTRRTNNIYVYFGTMQRPESIFSGVRLTVEQRNEVKQADRIIPNMLHKLLLSHACYIQNEAEGVQIQREIAPVPLHRLITRFKILHADSNYYPSHGNRLKWRDIAREDAEWYDQYPDNRPRPYQGEAHERVHI